MKLYSYRLFICIFFMGIFVQKMVVTAVPVILAAGSCNEKTIIPDLEQEHSSGGDAKDLLKYSDYKHADFHSGYVVMPLVQDPGIKNCLIDHYKRYVNPHYPSVPTPPPNSFVI